MPQCLRGSEAAGFGDALDIEIGTPKQFARPSDVFPDQPGVRRQAGRYLEMAHEGAFALAGAGGQFGYGMCVTQMRPQPIEQGPDRMPIGGYGSRHIFRLPTLLAISGP